MAAAVSITRLDLSASALRAAAGKAKNAAAARRMLALAMVLEGCDRTPAANTCGMNTCGMDRQPLRDWVHRDNAEGLAGPRARTAPGAKPRLTAAQKMELATLVEAGPDRALHGVVRWRRVDLRDELKRRFGVELHERSVGRIVAALGCRRLSVRPRHREADEEAQEAFKKTLLLSLWRSVPMKPKASRSKSGLRTKRGSDSKAR